METYIRKVELEAVKMDDSWIILHPTDYTVTKMNGLGGVCWNLLSERQSIPSLREEIQRMYEVSNDVAEKDIKQFLSQMVDVGLVTK